MTDLGGRQVAACREARLESEDEAWQRAAEWYQDCVRHNDYVNPPGTWRQIQNGNP